MVLTLFCAQNATEIKFLKPSSWQSGIQKFLPYLLNPFFFLISSCCHLNFNFFNCDKHLCILNTTCFSFELASWVFPSSTHPEVLVNFLPVLFGWVTESYIEQTWRDKKPSPINFFMFCILALISLTNASEEKRDLIFLSPCRFLFCMCGIFCCCFNEN